MSLEDLLSNKDKSIDNAIASFDKSLTNAQKVIYDNLKKELLNLKTDNGDLKLDPQSTEFLTKIDKTIQKSFNQSGYTSAVNDLLMSFDVINKNVIAIQNTVNNVKVNYNSLKMIQRVEVKNVTNSLIGNGMSEELVKPMRQGLYRHILSGGSVYDAEQIIQKFVLNNPEVNAKWYNYAQQISRDSIFQYDGIINAKIANETGMNAYRYVGTLIEDSRAQCKRWVKKGTIKASELEKEIEWANTYGSGMIIGTTPASFPIDRGGYNCRHHAIPTFINE